MNRLILLIMLAAGLGGCASANTPVATCTNLVSVEGGLLQFCQTANKIEVSESGIDMSQTTREARIVDDLATLQTIANDLHVNPSFKASRSLVTRACLIKDKTYVTVAMDDLKRITRRQTDDSSNNPQ